MGEIKYQLLARPSLVSADLGASCLLTRDLNYLEGFPMLIFCIDRIYGGYRSIFRNTTDDDLKLDFQSYLQGIFIGGKAGIGPHLRPEIHYYFKDLEKGYIVFGLGFQFK